MGTHCGRVCADTSTRKRLYIITCPADQAGLFDEAARLYLAHAQTLLQQGVGNDPVAVACGKSLACVRKCASPSDQCQRVEANALITVLGTWTLEEEHLDRAIARCGDSTLIKSRP